MVFRRTRLISPCLLICHREMNHCVLVLPAHFRNSTRNYVTKQLQRADLLETPIKSVISAFVLWGGGQHVKDATTEDVAGFHAFCVMSQLHLGGDVPPLPLLIKGAQQFILQGAFVSSLHVEKGYFTGDVFPVFLTDGSDAICSTEVSICCNLCHSVDKGCTDMGFTL